MTTLLPPNASPLERALDATIGRDTLPVPITTLWDADTCPESALAWLAWALRVSEWSSEWDEAQKRQAIKESYQIHRHKGTLLALKQVIGHFGGNIALREWWQQSPPGPPHTFDLVLTLTGSGGKAPTAGQIEAVIAAIHRVKPVRSHFTFTQGVQARSDVPIVAAARAVVYRRLSVTEN